MCGLVAIVARDEVFSDIYDALTILQHRGQDAAGIVTCENDRLNLRKENGLVRDVFQHRHFDMLKGTLGLGHVRYPTAGSASAAEAQPMYVNSPFGISLAHNGNLLNGPELLESFVKTDSRHINTDSDSELLLNVFADELQKGDRDKEPADQIFSAVRALHSRVNGAYAVVALITGFGIVGFRDPNGIRPLIYGKRGKSGAEEFMIASESVALSVLGFQPVSDVMPGEAVFIDTKGNVSVKQCFDQPRYTPCIFEYVYLARPDSVIDKVSVYKARLKMGEKLADKISRVYPDNDIDVVIPIPDTSCTAALPMAHRLGVKYREGLVKNRYIGRTFIMPGQEERNRSVRRKLSPIELEFRGKNVLLVDDSIVRGTTSKQIVQMARDSGAKKVYLASAAPPVKFPNVYGIDMPAASEFIAHDVDEGEVARYIGADWVIYQDLDDLIASASGINPKINGFDCSIFSGEYVTGALSEKYFQTLSDARVRLGLMKNTFQEKLLEIHNQD